jgi:hypothetical protein
MVSGWNLQGAKELFGWGLKPAYSIWKLDTQMYVTNLNVKIKWKKTKPLKDLLIAIHQKVECIENYLLQCGKMPEISKKDIREAVIHFFDDVIGSVEIAKKFIETNFRIKT